MDLKDDLSRIFIWSLYASGVSRSMAARNAGQGGILAFHRICRPKAHEFASQAGLSVTPENFRRILQKLIRQDYRFVTMSGLFDRLRNPEKAERQKFICLTFDDGFVDTYTKAFPICLEFGVPMTVYLVSGFVRREFPMWSAGLEAAITAHDRLKYTWDGEEFRLDAGTMEQKRRAYFAIAARLVTAPPHIIRQVCAELGTRYGVDFMALGDPYALTPSMIAEMQASGLVDFGAHGVSHACLGRLGSVEARWEIAKGKRDCEALVGSEVRHFAYPYGDRDAVSTREIEFCRELGFCTAVTTESNTIFASDRHRLLALPRLTYNGKYQNTPLLDLLLSGTLPWLRRRMGAIPFEAEVGYPVPTPRADATGASL